MRLIDADAINPMRCPRSIAEMREWLNEMPTVGPKKGKWIPITNGRMGFECNQCRNYAPSYQNGVEWLSDFCPNCGARMEE